MQQWSETTYISGGYFGKFLVNDNWKVSVANVKLIHVKKYLRSFPKKRPKYQRRGTTTHLVKTNKILKKKIWQLGNIKRLCPDLI